MKMLNLGRLAGHFINEVGNVNEIARITGAATF
jgi:hypothetical protein